MTHNALRPQRVVQKASEASPLYNRAGIAEVEAFEKRLTTTEAQFINKS